MTQQTQQPNDNSKRQPERIANEDFDAAFLAAIQRAVSSRERVTPANSTNEQLLDDADNFEVVDEFDVEFALSGLVAEVGFDIQIVDESSSPSYQQSEDLSAPTLDEPYSPNYQQSEDLSPQASTSLPQPKANDAVLGGQNPVPIGTVILGGFEGVKSRLTSSVAEQRVATLTEALKYGQAGIDLVIQALDDSSMSVKRATYQLLWNASGSEARKLLQDYYNPYQFFECTFSSYIRELRSIAISPDSQNLAVGNNDAAVQLWNLSTGKRLNILRGHVSSVTAIAISPDSQTLVSGSEDGIIKLWNLHTGELLRTLTGHRMEVTSLAISSDSQAFVSGGNDGNIKLWNLHSGEQESLFRRRNLSPVTAVAISPDGQTLVSGTDRNITFYNSSTRKRRHTDNQHSHPVISLTIPPNGRTLISASNDGQISEWNLHTGEQKRSFAATFSAVAISPDGHTLATGRRNCAIKIWSLHTNQLLCTLNGHSDKISSLAISPNGQTLVSYSDDGIIKVWGWQ